MQEPLHARKAWPTGQAGNFLKPTHAFARVGWLPADSGLQMLRLDVCPCPRGHFLATSTFGATSLAAIAPASLCRDTTDLKVIRLEIRLQRLPFRLDGLRIVQLGDFRYDR